MKNIWALSYVVFIYVVHVESFCQCKVNLQSKKRILLAKHVFELNIQLWPVECSLIISFCIVQSYFIQYTLHDDLC